MLKPQMTFALVFLALPLWWKGSSQATPGAEIHAPVEAAKTTQVPVVFSGGYETDPRDHGRPVVLIASALGVPPEVFREAFSHVRPAPAGTEPDPEQVRRNKDALLSALSRYGVTNERLDEVSNYYRYRPQNGELWPTTPAKAYATLQGNKITGFVVTEAGSGYCSAPIISVPGVNADKIETQLTFAQDFDKNGSVAAIRLKPNPKRP